MKSIALLLFLLLLSFGISAQPKIEDDGGMLKWAHAAEIWDRNAGSCDSLAFASRLMMRAARSMEIDLVADSVWQTLESCPPAYPLLYEMGLYHITFQQWEAASERFISGLAACPSDLRGRFFIMLAICERELGNYEPAVGYLEAFATSFHDDMSLDDMGNLARLWTEFGRPDLAAMSINNVIGIQGPESANLLLDLESRHRDFFLSLLFECAIELGDCNAASTLAQLASTLPLATEAMWIGLELRRLETCEPSDIQLGIVNEVIKKKDLYEAVSRVAGRSIFLLPNVRQLMPDSVRDGVAEFLRTHPIENHEWDGTSIWPQRETHRHLPWLLGLAILILLGSIAWLYHKARALRQPLPDALLSMSKLLDWTQGQINLSNTAKAASIRSLERKAHCLFQNENTEHLSAREAEVQRMLWHGHSHKEIAQTLNISTKYVYNISSNIRLKRKSNE